MRHLLLIPILLSAMDLYCQHIVIFAREDACYLNAEKVCKRESNIEIAFFEDYKKAIEKALPKKEAIKLETPPLEWGKKVNDATYGELAYQPSYLAGFVTDLALYNMLPNHNYRLCLNGRPDLVGNELLPLPVRGNEKEKYYDVLTIKTNEKGEYHANLAILLKQGNYHVRFYVKDTDDFKIVLYHDYFKFTVK